MSSSNQSLHNGQQNTVLSANQCTIARHCSQLPTFYIAWTKSSGNELDAESEMLWFRNGQYAGRNCIIIRGCTANRLSTRWEWCNTTFSKIITRLAWPASTAVSPQVGSASHKVRSGMLWGARCCTGQSWGYGIGHHHWGWQHARLCWRPSVLKRWKWACTQWGSFHISSFTT